VVSVATEDYLNYLSMGKTIVLEDDCFALITFFFEFCRIVEYRDDERVMMINDSNLIGDWKSDKVIIFLCMVEFGMGILEKEPGRILRLSYEALEI